MKKYSYIGVAFIILIFGIYAIPKIVDRIKNNDFIESDKIEKESIRNIQLDSIPKLVKVGKVPGFEFTNQDGELISNLFYENKVWVVEFFFTTCPTICPRMNENMVKIQNEFYANIDFGIASFSINPKHDTPEVLKVYAKAHGATLKNWHFLTGDQEKIYELANTGFTLFAGENSDAEGGFEHSGMFALIDKKGNIRSGLDEYGNPIGFYDGLDSKGVRWIIRDIAILLKE